MRRQPLFDVVIVGGGLVGAAFARALSESGLNVALVEGRPVLPPGPAGQDARVYAISPGNVERLGQLGAWPALAPERHTPIREMQVFGDAGARIHFDSLDVGRPDLGSIAENQALLEALWRALPTQGNLTLYCPARCTALAIEAEQAVLTLDHGQAISARLVVGADGARSWVRSQSGLAATLSGYGQQAVVANFAIDKPHRQVASQWFQQPDILAWLPLPGQRMSMVWSMEEAHATALLAQEDAAFCETVAAAGQHCLGRLSLVTRPVAFPLQMLQMPTFVQPRLALIGDAAHTVHPLAGQGVNLGFQDAWALADALAAPGARYDCGDYLILRRFERARKSDIQAMQIVTDGLHRLFAARHAGLRLLRNRGLGFTDQNQWLKKRLMQHAIL